MAIAVPPARVYEFVRDARNFPRWAFFRSATDAGDHWIMEAPDGPVKLRFLERNTLGVLDHDVTLGNGTVVHVPLRVIANGDGCEILLTVFQLPGTTDAAFDADGAQVHTDLTSLKRLLESP